MSASQSTVEININILNETSTNCNTTTFHNDLIASCSHLKRLITALRYFELLRISKGREKGSALFGDFCAEFYQMFLNDYIHFTRSHLNDAAAINECAQKKYGFSTCAVSHCKVQRRESRRRTHKAGTDTDTKKRASDDTDRFYSDVMANVHFVLRHLREHGLRTISRALPANAKDEEHKDDDDDEIECVDAQFAEKAAQIAQSQKVCGTELGGSSKFTIQIGGGAPAKNLKGKGKSTFMDALCAFLRAHSDLGRERVLALLDAEHFDSESVQLDLALDAADLLPGGVASAPASAPLPDAAPIPAHAPPPGGGAPVSLPGAPMAAPLPGSAPAPAPLPGGAAPAPFPGSPIAVPLPGGMAPAPMPGRTAPAPMPPGFSAAPMPPMPGGTSMPGGGVAAPPPIAAPGLGPAGNLASGALRADIGCFIRDYRIDGRSLSTGLNFQYHAWYATAKGIVDQEGFGAVQRSALFVRARFNCIKSEVLNSAWLSSMEFDEFIVDKTKRYFATTDCKAIQCKAGGDPLHFDIEVGELLREEHLYALFLYTDFSALSTDFSSSFRAVYRGESVESIKARNDRYHHFAKLLKELVMYFGVDGHHYRDRSSGPFYCGMSAVLNIPQFAIRLNGPPSTSLHIEVAMRCGGTEGMIIQLNNTRKPASLETHFDCGWLSAFPEESERLFIGGRFMLELESVRIVETKNNYGRFLHAFHVFDSMLSGQPKKATKKDVRIVRGAVRGYLGIESNGYHTFVNDTFHHFCASKTKIVLRLKDMRGYIGNEVIMNQIKWRHRRWNNSDTLDNVNLLKPVLFALFRNVQELEIDARQSFWFNLEQLSQFAFPKALRRISIEGKWLKVAFIDSLKQTLNDQGWEAKLKKKGRSWKLSIVR